jgi:hypothetical protein
VDDRRDHAGGVAAGPREIVLTVYPDGFIYGQVDPGALAPGGRHPYYDRLRAMAKMLLVSDATSCSPATRRPHHAG